MNQVMKLVTAAAGVMCALALLVGNADAASTEAGSLASGGGFPDGGVIGTGTANTVPLWTAPHTLGNSVVTQSGGNLATTGLVRGPDGTAAAPTYTFTNDSDTGFYSVGGGEVDFAANGVVGGYFNTVGMGFVGDGSRAVFELGPGAYVGTARKAVISWNPDLSAVATNLPAVQGTSVIDSVNASNGYGMAVGNRDLTGRFDLVAGNASRVTILANGNFGIGDQSPAALFTVGSGDLFQVISTGEARGPAGAVGAPTYSTTGDTDTGVYFSAANEVTISTGGAQGLTVNSTQHVLVQGDVLRIVGVTTTAPTCASDGDVGRFTRYSKTAGATISVCLCTKLAGAYTLTALGTGDCT